MSSAYDVKLPWYHQAQEFIYRLGVSKVLPLRMLHQRMPTNISPTTGRLTVEIVSHCWRYSHLLAYQLSSLINHPPQNVDVVMTVFYSEEDEATTQLLAFFAERFAELGAEQGEEHGADQGVEHRAEQKGAKVRCNWQQLTPPQLFRRSIGRNQAALNSSADWVWFTDCDLYFGAGALDSLGQVLQGCNQPLVYPREERVTALLTDDSPMLKATKVPEVVAISEADFETKTVTRATGPLQITHGDVARRMGYCKDVSVYQRPEPKWAKCREDRAFRWMLETQGTPVDIPAVYRIRHLEKGRYHGNQKVTSVRKKIRQRQSEM